MSADIKKAFTLPFSDPKWPQKLVILIALFALNSFIGTPYSQHFHLNPWIPLLAIILVTLGNGYIFQYAQNEQNNENKALPEWDNFRTYFINGLKLGIAYLIYATPVILMSFVAGGIAYSLSADKGTHNEGMMPLFIILVLLLFVYSLVFWFLSPYITQGFVENYKFRDAFRLGKILDLIFSNFADYLISGVISTVLVIIIIIPFAIFQKSIIGVIVLAILTPYYSLVVSNLFAQSYRESKTSDNKEVPTSSEV